MRPFNMSKEDKMIERLLSCPADYTYDEAVNLAKRFGYVLQNKGNTSGSRVMLYREGDGRKILLHRPHPGKIMKQYAVRLFLEKLRESGDIHEEHA